MMTIPKMRNLSCSNIGAESPSELPATGPDHASETMP